KTATCTPSSRARRRVSTMTLAWSSCVPCEKFSRTTFTPTRIKSRKIDGSREAGPIVATILVRFVAGCTIGMRFSSTATMLLRPGAGRYNFCSRTRARIGQQGFGARLEGRPSEVYRQLRDFDRVTLGADRLVLGYPGIRSGRLGDERATGRFRGRHHHASATSDPD